VFGTDIGQVLSIEVIGTGKRFFKELCDSILTVSLFALITLTRNTERFSNYSLFDLHNNQQYNIDTTNHIIVRDLHVTVYIIT